MFYEEYLNTKARRNTCRKKFEKERKQQNAPITIRDLVVTPNKSDLSYGESKTNTKNKPGNTFKRLVHHIDSLFEMTNAYHQHAYCEPQDNGTYQLKKQYQNTITRLSLNEFSLYGKEPLSLDEFGKLVDEIQQMAERAPDNVHLLLSSFSVATKGTLLNIVLYVQGGKDAKIDVVCKGLASDNDIKYGRFSNYSQQKIGIVTDSVNPFIAGQTQEESIISNNSLLEIKTHGGARYIQGIDICMDHANLHTKRLLEKQLRGESIDTANFIPEQADHIVTSNSIEVEEDSKITPTVLHVDPRGTEYYDEENRRPVDKRLVLDPKTLSTISSKYTSMNINAKTNGLSVTNPPFGADYSVTVYQEWTLKGYVPAIAPQVQKANELIMSRRIDNLMESRTTAETSKLKEYHVLEQAGNKAYESATRLLEHLSKQCKPNFFEYIFGTQNYYLKKEALAIIATSSSLLIELNKSEDFLISDSPWFKDLQLRLNRIDNGLPHSFIKKTSELMDNYSDILSHYPEIL